MELVRLRSALMYNLGEFKCYVFKKVLYFTLDKHCVLHMHHRKYTDASILDLGRVHSVWSP